MKGEKYTTGKPCKRGHIAERYVSTRQCVECLGSFRKRWRSVSANRQRELAFYKTPEGRAKKANSARERYVVDPSKSLSQSAKWKRKNATRVKDYAKEYGKRNPGLRCYWQSLRRRRQVAWADKGKIREIYLEAQRISTETGVPHEVDHVIPLKGRFVSGLHVETNLRIIPKSENQKKRNRFMDGF